MAPPIPTLESHLLQLVKTVGLSARAKAIVEIAVSLSVFFLVGFDAFALQDSRGFATRKERDEPTTTDKKELGPGIPRWKELEDTSVPLDAAEKTSYSDQQ
jgi:hypothetical protein